MNVLRKALVGAAVVATSFSAQAIESTFTFKVLSSGPNIYACNAGIRHINTADQYGYDYGSGSDSVAHTTTVNPGNYLQDAYWYKFVELVEEDFYAVGPTRGKGHKRANGSSNFVLADATAPYNLVDAAKDFDAHRVGGWYGNPKALSGLQIELSSEVYGAEYFVDVCYTGSRDQSDHVSVGVRLAAKASVMFEDLTGTLQDSDHNGIGDSETNLGSLNRKYNDLAGLKVKAELVCSEKGSITTSLKNPAGNGFADVSASNTFVAFNGNTVNRISQGGANNGNDAHKCVVRYSFKETSKKIRLNKLHGVKVILKTAITDPVL